MPNRVKRDSGTLDLLAKVPVNKGSLLKSIDNLLKTIESSESSVMIPTLLRDKCEFDAWELLFVAKILKASILGHTDLVEFYMNHIGLSPGQYSSSQQQQQQSNGNGNGNGSGSVSGNGNGSGSGNGSNGNYYANYGNGQYGGTFGGTFGTGGSQQDVSLSPSQMMRMMPSPTTASLSPSLVGESAAAATTSSPQQALPTTTVTTTTGPSSMASSAGSSAGANSTKSQQSSSAATSWVTANNNNGANTTASYSSCNSDSSGQLQHNSSDAPADNPAPTSPSGDGDSASSNGGSNSSSSSSSSSRISVNNSSSDSTQQAPSLTSGGISAGPSPCQQDQQTLLQAARPVLMRQAQPPSLLQLTTTNNHINSVAAIGVSSSAFTNSNIEKLTNQLTAMQQNGGLSTGVNNNNYSELSPQFGDRAPLSISTAAAAANSTGISPSIITTSTTATSNSSTATATNIQTGTDGSGASGNGTGMAPSRSAGCLFRLNSPGASSPRTPLQTPTTPYPQAETLANGLANGFPGDPSAPVKLLLQIEQLKSSISHVTKLLDSVVELYKKSIDNIAMA